LRAQKLRRVLLNQISPEVHQVKIRKIQRIEKILEKEV
jgi:hypothetical protein